MQRDGINTNRKGDNMRVTMSSTSNFDKTTLWLQKQQTRTPVKSLEHLGSQVVNALQVATPRKSGQTANGWKYRIEKTKYGWQLYWLNDSHPETQANIAKLINYGHATRNGGYVPPYPFIAPAVNGLIDAGSTSVLKEMMT